MSHRDPCPHGRYLSLLTFGAAALLLSPDPAGAGVVVRARADNAAAFSLSVTSGAFTVDEVHGLAGGANWVTAGTITEDADLNDEIEIDGSAQHVVAPHGELPGIVFPFSYSVNAGGLPGGWNVLPNVIGGGAHGAHTNTYQATLAVNVAAGTFVNDIKGYIFTVAGKHTEGSAQAFGGRLDPAQETDPVTSDAFGTINLLADGRSGRFDLTLAVANLSLADLIGAHVHVGAPGTPGGVAVALPLDHFQPFGNGVAAVFEDLGPAPQEAKAFAQALYAGNAYVNLHTNQYPNGEIRGQIVAVPEPGTAVLALAGLALLAGLRRRIG